MSSPFYAFDAFPGAVSCGRMEREITLSAVITVDLLTIEFASDPQNSEVQGVVFHFTGTLTQPMEDELDVFVATLDPTPIDPDLWTVDELSLAGAAGTLGEERFATDGRKSGENPDEGTGVPVWWDVSSAEWLTYCDNTPVQQ